MRTSFLKAVLTISLAMCIILPNSSKAQDSAKFIALHELATQPDGLHKAALSNGGIFEVGGHTAPRGRVPDLPSLTAASAMIVSARVLESHSLLTDQGRQIETVYSLDVDQTFKGSTATHLSLTMHGGSYKFSDGSIATQTENLGRPLVQNVEYILFLRSNTDQANMYHLAAVGQAVFEVARDGTHLYSHTYVSGDPLRDEANAGKAAFIQRLQGIIANH
jgi:hypothetical protein